MSDTSDLGGLQREIMQLVWAHAPITADEVRARLRRKLKESTIRTVLKRLEEKKFVIHRVDGRTFVYMPTSPREQAAAKAVKRIVDWFCNGSVEEVLVGMVDSKMLDRRQLEAFTKSILTPKGRRK